MRNEKGHAAMPWMRDMLTDFFLISKYRFKGSLQHDFDAKHSELFRFSQHLTSLSPLPFN